MAGYYMIILMCLILHYDIHVDGADCTNGWLEYDDSCYLFELKNHMTFSDSVHFCALQDSKLVQAETPAENVFIQDYMRDLNSEKRWMGMTDADTHDVFRWYGSSERPTYFDWDSSEPDQGYEDCVIYDQVHNYKWADIRCTDHILPICEKRANHGEGIIG